MTSSERKCLEVLAREKDSYVGCFMALTFKEIGEKAGLNRRQVKRAVHSLVHCGFVQYDRALWREDRYQLAGSGHSCTVEGIIALEEERVP